VVRKLQLGAGGLVAFLLLTVVACGGGGEGEVAPNTATAEVEDQLREMVL